VPGGSDDEVETPPVVAVDVGGTKVAAGIVRGAAVSDRVQFATPPRPGIGALVDAVRDIVARMPEVPGPVAVATAGLVRKGALQALNDTFDVPDWEPFQAPLAQALGRPVVLLNDAQAATCGEYRYGAGRGAASMVFLTLSTGIGGGIVADGRLLTGHQGLAGSIGQIRLDPGNPGSPRLEEKASGAGLARLATAVAGRPVPADRALADDDPALQALVAEMARLVAGAIAGLAATVDPQLVVIGGGLGLAPGVLDKLRATLQAYPPLYRPALVAAVLGHDVGLVGAADWRSRLGSG